MKLMIEKADIRLDDEMIAAVQSSLSVQFARAFVMFVKDHDGVVPPNNSFRISSKNHSGVTQFIALSDISRQAEFLSPSVTRAFFPFAFAEGGNFVCMARSDDAAVYFYDHEIDGMAALTRIAKSFEEFMGALELFDVASVVLAPGQVISVWIDPDFLSDLKS
ncbi:hypothetical protein FIV34_12925 [Luteibacter pinisoli]|uniref:Knr4/Smi1-like domain-containing protein n=1 Tax=Luteibacter pinisoli TaxID=2589080 RepID=A0A4Y5Z4M2_9GAMM|nr:SMI1/KNR4 family protein [Luteibacter pinisoli]QDE40054.1 hypothetical protein FIV34_12925 [Luteibacter pinisoli]